MADSIETDQIEIVLYRPRYPENIGSVARAMCNMGFSRLRVVAPHDCDLTRILKLATHAAAEVIERMEVFEDLETALAPFNYVVGTSARLGARRQADHTARSLGPHLLTLAPENRVAIVFGPEDRGLTNEALRRCHILVTIPSAQFASLNLAQAVMIICYELFGTRARESTARAPRLASRHELDGMYEQVKQTLVKISYINPENPDYWMNKIRRFFTRLQLQAREVSIIRGICRQIDWYGGQCQREGAERKKRTAGNPPEEK